MVTESATSLDTYKLQDFPISGQYVVLSDIRKVSPLVRNRVKLWSGRRLILCRDVYTISSEWDKECHSPIVEQKYENSSILFDFAWDMLLAE
ncbi:hypothetical protein NQ317_013087 [Molorchus minor]|uniref:Uncharacterized protein n=1 Tax=Molorchus minor TaxID=1323400 RepID=A0ABQ9J0W5_9CUCU|nr:hypothetical protein NQ317_013087 [Molorchus minor]